MPDARSILAGLVLAAIALPGCGASVRPFPLKEPMWRDPDRRPFAQEPEEYFSPFAWDGANQLVFRPISRFFAVDPAGESVNVNALDEVPDSSWFSNRLGRHGMTPAEVEQGVCDTPMPNARGPWTIFKAKPNGFNPGFFVKGSDDKRYVMKFDHHPEGPRPTASDIIGTRIFHAAGYFVPCNRITYIEASSLRIDPDADSEDAQGEKIKLEQAGVDDVLKRSIRMTDGRYRASISLFIEGKPLGPWSYEGTRDDDPNDVVNHEDRRELRGMYVLASWLGYADSREQNTMGSFIEAPGGGYVRHYMLDVGNIFGSVWEPPMLGRRIGHSYYFDVPYILEDFITFGAIERPWDTLRFGPTGSIFGYYDVAHYTPDRFRPGYPNPAFVRRSERDSAWMARILARFTDAHVEAAVAAGMLTPVYRNRLVEVLKGRRDKLFSRYLTRLSPLTWPKIEKSTGTARLCLEDMGLVARVTRPERRLYGVRTWLGESADAGPAPKVALKDGRFACLPLPSVPGASASSPRYLMVDVASGAPGQKPIPPARVHLYHLGGSDYRVVGLERPDDFDAPG
jgi:hypothetical protein